MTINIISLTEPGLALATALKEKLSSTGNEAMLHHKPTPFTKVVQTLFNEKNELIFICATGIVFRTLAPVIKSKLIDPPVLVLDEEGKFVIPLLSGHEGGANQLGNKVARLLGSQLVITSAANYVEPVYTVGMGCERNCPTSYLEGLLNDCLQQAGISNKSIKALASIDIKSDEVGLIETANHWQWTFTTLNKEALATVEDQLTQKSDIVFREVGVYGVAEAAALVAASNITGQPSELILPKQKNTKATCAIARSFYE